MSFAFYQEKNIELNFSARFKTAVASLFHLCLIDQNNDCFLPLSDKESLQAALEFYQERILKNPTYPVYNGQSFLERPSKDKEVLRQVLGLPDVVFKKLDLEGDLLSQLRFSKEAESLKKRIYTRLYEPKKQHWYRDDFKNYCLKEGFFFLYDETKPFVRKEEEMLPVYINEKRLTSPIVFPLYKEATSERFAIDILQKKANFDFIAEMKKYDAFSFDERLDYFVNGHYNPEISKLNPSLEFKEQYAAILRQYLASLINVLYDQYSFKVLNKVTMKMSYLSQTRVSLTKRKYYSLSSFNAEMYSTDRKNWYFSLRDKERIRDIVSDVLSQGLYTDTLLFYSQLGLPFFGYAYIRFVKTISVDSIMDALPFRRILDSSIFLVAAKRYDDYYSYLNSEKEYRYVFYRRLLIEQGIIYNWEDPFNEKEQNKVTILLENKERIPELRAIFDEPGLSLAKDFLPIFTMEVPTCHYDYLNEDLSLLDSKSLNKACFVFFHSLQNKTIKEAVNELLTTYHVPVMLYADLEQFFYYLAMYPLKIASNEFRRVALEKGDNKALLALDGFRDKTETYEPNLPYPYVSYGKLCYSFRENYHSKAYVCSSEKQAIASRISYFDTCYDQSHKADRNDPDYFVKRNKFVLQHLGLPMNILRQIDPNDGLLLQIPFKDNICHHCLNSQPSYYEEDEVFFMDDRERVHDYNTYRSYILAQEGCKGVYFVNNPDEDAFNGLLQVDEAIIDPILEPYLPKNSLDVASLFTTFFYFYLAFDPNSTFFNAFSVYQDSDIKNFFYQYKAGEDNKDPEDNPLLCFGPLYLQIERAYGVEVSQKRIPSLADCCFTLGHDYNPRLPLPYVLLGRVYNAYKESANSEDIYFCECDRESMKGFMELFFEGAKQCHIHPRFVTAYVLGMTGLPYEAVKKYSDFDLSLYTIEQLLQKMHFRRHICRRCTNFNHAALSMPFVKAFPYKENLEAEKNFAINALAHDHVLITYPYLIQSVEFSPSYFFNVYSSFDGKLTAAVVFKNPSLRIFNFFHMGEERLKEYLFQFEKVCKKKKEAVELLPSVILSSYALNPDLFYNFFFDETLNRDTPFKKQIESLFKGTQDVNPELEDAVIDLILSFLSYLFTDLLHEYALDENHVGR